MFPLKVNLEAVMPKMSFRQGCIHWLGLVVIWFQVALAKSQIIFVLFFGHSIIMWSIVSSLPHSQNAFSSHPGMFWKYVPHLTRLWIICHIKSLILLSIIVSFHRCVHSSPSFIGAVVHSLRFSCISVILVLLFESAWFR